MDLQAILNTPTAPRTPSPPPLPSTPIRIQRNQETSRDKRIMIQTALLFNHSYKEIREKLKVTDKQIWLAKRCRLTPQKARKNQNKLAENTTKSST